MGVKRRQAKRLPEDVVATHVRIQLDVDPERGRAISGRVQLDLELDEPRRFLLLHAAELRVSEALLHCGAGEWPGRIRAIPEQEMIRVDFPERLPAGPATLSLRFRGRLRDDLRGLYHARSGGRAYAISQLAATHARRVSPCLDEPAKKACFQLSVTTDAEHQVISNQPRRRLERRSDGRHTHHFAATPPIASYLVALAVGRFEATRSQRVGETPIRVWTVPGKKQLGGFALQAARASLERLEAWFGLPHPYAKLDLVAVPDFELGAMENVGAVFFRETALLLEPATASSAERRRVAEIVAHELSHMWFGNLVTMAWWDDLWLKSASSGRGHRELRHDHLREGRSGDPHARAQPRGRRLQARRAALHPPPPGGQCPGAGSVAGTRRSGRAQPDAGGPGLDRATRAPDRSRAPGAGRPVPRGAAGTGQRPRSRGLGALADCLRRLPGATAGHARARCNGSPIARTHRATRGAAARLRLRERRRGRLLSGLAR
jgi:hypothetical protein